MEELAIKIAEMLDISVQAAIDMYPVIRSQYIWYRVLTNVNAWALILWFGSIIITGIAWIVRNDTTKYDWRTEEINEEWVDIDKIFKIGLSVVVSSVVIAIVTDMIIPFLAPDIMIIKNFLG